jgi:RimJ/RimL family protein N-acetyltransferase
MNGAVIRFGQSLDDVVARRITEIVEERLPARTLRPSPEVMNAVREAFKQQAPTTREEGGPVYHFPESIPQAIDVVQLTEDNVELVRETFPWLLHELAEWWPCFAMVRDGDAVSICFSSRIGPRACEAGVQTLPDFRGRGYAAAVTTAWGASILSSGRIPLYSTSWENLASQGVARRLGLILVGSDATWM